MKIKYLNYKMAEAISSDYQYLAGHPFGNHKEEKHCVVRQVVMAPYSRILQWQFIRLLLNGVLLNEALSICLNGRYDVLVIPDIKYDPRQPPPVKNLRDYLQEQGIAFLAEKYNHLRSL